MQRHLYFMANSFDVRILGFVLMSNHFHMLILAPHEDLSAAMAYFLRETSREFVRFSQRINRTYGGRYFRSNIRSYHHYLNCYEYMCRNPLAAGLAQRVEDYPWSTLRGLLGQERLLIPVWEDQTLFSDVEGTMQWLNQKPKAEFWKAVRKALRRKVFEFPKDRNTKKAHALETELL
jgi:REP element-mobilizing transposase RayT